jgi:hypothetical protein
MMRTPWDLLRIYGINSEHWGLLLNDLSVNEFLLSNLIQSIIRISKYYLVYQTIHLKLLRNYTITGMDLDSSSWKFYE